MNEVDAMYLKKICFLWTLLLLVSCHSLKSEENQNVFNDFSENITTLEGEPSQYVTLSERNLLQTAKDDGFLIAHDVDTMEYMVIGYEGEETEITIPLIATIIGSKAFINNDKITVVNIPNHVQKIMFGAFNECSSLQKIYIPSSVSSIVNPFMYCESVTIYVEENSFADAWIQGYNSSLTQQNLGVNILNVEYY